MIFIGVLHFINPDARIAEFNLARLQDGQRFDIEYVTSLSADSVPTLMQALPDLSESQRCELWRYMQSHRVLGASDDWRNFNLARNRARDLLSSVSSSCQ
jgi:hypothetical protein